VDVARTEAAHAELIRTIECRSRQKDPDEEGELWREAVRRHAERQREENRLAWYAYFERLAASLRSRAEEYDHGAQTLMEDKPKGAS
jgi:hypothetical protein